MKKAALLIVILFSLIVNVKSQTIGDLIVQTKHSDYTLLSTRRYGAYIEAWISQKATKGHIVEFRQLMIKSLKAGKFKTAGFDKYTETKNKIIIDCANQRYKLLESIDYDNDGSVLDSYTKDEYEAKWNDVVPGTVSAAYINYFCSNVKPTEKKEVYIISESNFCSIDLGSLTITNDNDAGFNFSISITGNKYKSDGRISGRAEYTGEGSASFVTGDCRIDFDTHRKWSEYTIRDNGCGTYHDVNVCFSGTYKKQ